MPTSFLSLRPEMRCQIYDLSLPVRHITVKLHLRYQQKGRWDWTIPGPGTLRYQLSRQRHVIALLFVSRQINADLQATIYNTINLHFCARMARPRSTASNDSTLMRALKEVKGLAQLISRVKSVSVPAELQFAWEGIWKKGGLWDDEDDEVIVEYYENPSYVIRHGDECDLSALWGT